MASSITHIVYGKKVFERLDNSLSWPEFVAGTLLPDIRYISGIDREKVHFPVVSEKEIPLNSSFNAGLYTHSFIDRKREEIVRDKGIYTYVSDNYEDGTAIKLLEDEFLYDRYNDWGGTIKLLDSFYPEEYLVVSDKAILKKWHRMNQEYFRTLPSPKTWSKFTLDLGFDENLIKKLLDEIAKIRKIPEAMAIIRETYKEI